MKAGTATQSQLSSFATAHGTFANELANTGNVSVINTVIANNASVIANYNTANFPASTLIKNAAAFNPAITEQDLINAIGQWESSYSSTLVSQGIAPQIQNLLQAIQALESEAAAGPVRYRLRRQSTGAHLKTTEYRGGAHLLEANWHWSTMMGVAAACLGIGAVIIGAAAVGPVVTIAGIALGLDDLCAIMSAYCWGASEVDSEYGW